jgi:hypothetical protein
VQPVKYSWPDEQRSPVLRRFQKHQNSNPYKKKDLKSDFEYELHDRSMENSLSLLKIRLDVVTTGCQQSLCISCFYTIYTKL